MDMPLGKDPKAGEKMDKLSIPQIRVFLRHLTYLVTVGFFFVLAAAFLNKADMDPSKRDLISMLIGVLISKWSTIIDFWFGASRK